MQRTTTETSRRQAGWIMAGLALGVATAQAATPIFQDTFEGTAVNEEVWQRTGWASPIQTVANGCLRLAILGDAHRANIVTLREDFNFYQQPVTLEWVIDNTRTLPKPFNYKTSSYRAAHSLRITEGSDTPTTHGDAVILAMVADRDRITDQPDRDFHRLGLTRVGSPTALLANGELDGVPSRILWTLNGKNWTVSIEGAQFVAGHATERSGNIDRDESHFDRFRVLLSAGGTADFTANAYVDRIAVYGPPPPTGTVILLR